MIYTPESAAAYLDHWLPEWVPIRRGVPDAARIGPMLIALSAEKVRTSGGRIQESQAIMALVDYLDAEYGKVLAH